MCVYNSFQFHKRIQSAVPSAWLYFLHSRPCARPMCIPSDARSSYHHHHHHPYHHHHRHRHHHHRHHHVGPPRPNLHHPHCHPLPSSSKSGAESKRPTLAPSAGAWLRCGGRRTVGRPTSGSPRGPRCAGCTLVASPAPRRRPGGAKWTGRGACGRRRGRWMSRPCRPAGGGARCTATAPVFPPCPGASGRQQTGRTYTGTDGSGRVVGSGDAPPRRRTRGVTRSLRHHSPRAAAPLSRRASDSTRGPRPPREASQEIRQPARTRGAPKKRSPKRSYRWRGRRQRRQMNRGST